MKRGSTAAWGGDRHQACTTNVTQAGHTHQAGEGGVAGLMRGRAGADREETLLPRPAVQPRLSGPEASG